MPDQEPDLHLGAFSLFVFGRQFEASNDYWDGNWLHVLARVEAERATVEAGGTILHLGEIARFTKELDVLNGRLGDSACLRCMAPNLAVELRAVGLGHIKVTVKITPDHMAQWHKFQFEVDQTFLHPLTRDCKRLLAAFPIRGAPDEIPNDLRDDVA